MGSFNLRAIWFASEVLAVVVIGAFVYEIARGQGGQPYALLGFVFAVAYVAALLWLRWRGLGSRATTSVCVRFSIVAPC